VLHEWVIKALNVCLPHLCIHLRRQEMPSPQSWSTPRVTRLSSLTASEQCAGDVLRMLALSTKDMPLEC
jgi:hypothetical protein